VRHFSFRLLYDILIFELHLDDSCCILLVSVRLCCIELRGCDGERQLLNVVGFSTAVLYRAARMRRWKTAVECCWFQYGCVVSSCADGMVKDSCWMLLVSVWLCCIELRGWDGERQLLNVVGFSTAVLYRAARMGRLKTAVECCWFQYGCVVSSCADVTVKDSCWMLLVSVRLCCIELRGCDGERQLLNVVGFSTAVLYRAARMGRWKTAVKCCWFQYGCVVSSCADGTVKDSCWMLLVSVRLCCIELRGWDGERQLLNVVGFSTAVLYRAARMGRWKSGLTAELRSQRSVVTRRKQTDVICSWKFHSCSSQACSK